MSTDMRVFDDGGGMKFTMTLHRKPWPKVGDVIEFGFDRLSFRGAVTSWETTSMRGRDRVYYHLHGTVLSFEAAAASGEDL